MTLEDKIIRLIQYIFYVLGFGAIIFLFVFSSLIFPKSQAATYYTKDYTTGWVTADGESANIKNLNRYDSIYNTVPQVETDSMIFINLRYTNVTVYMDDEQVYQSEAEYFPFTGKAPGTYNIKIYITPQDVGKTIRIDIQSPYTDRTARINNAVVGDVENVTKTQINTRMFDYLSSLISIFIGAVFMILYLPLRKLGENVKAILYLGLFAFNMGAFTLFDGGMLQVLYNHEAFIHTLAEMFMTLVVLPLLMYLQRQYQGISKIEFIVVGIISILNIIICAVLNMTGILDYHETTRLIHVVFVLAIFLILKSLIRARREKQYMHIIGMGAVIVGSILDMVLWSFTTMNSTTFFTKIALIAFLCCEAVQFVVNYLLHQNEVARKSFVHELAYKDGLTGLLNRTSYEEELQQYRDTNSLPKLVAFFDINRLKTMNDTYGHNVGDELITKVSDAITAEFAPHGKCFRIGGDEFVFIAKDNVHNVEKLKENVMERLDGEHIDQAPEFKISVAIGYVTYYDTFVSIDEMVDLADQLMYRNKRQIKNQEAQGEIYDVN